MTADPSELSTNLGRNLRALRERQGLTQQQLTDRSGVPRATLANLESGGANPTLSVMGRVADALGVTLEELVAPPRAVFQHYPLDSLRHRSRQGVSIRKLLPDPIPGVDLERMALPPGARLTGIPHTPGTREYLTCERGQVELRVAGERVMLAPGEVVVFQGDQRHGYHNPGTVEAIAWSAVLLHPETPS